MRGSIIVTGATGSMGSAAVETLSRDGHAVTMACRNTAKAEKVRSDILTRHPDASIEIRELDFSSMESVQRFVEGIEEGSVAALFNNAGTISKGYSHTSDGLENTFAVNYFGPWLLTTLLAEKMVPGGRIVNMVSLTCKYVNLSADSLKPTEKEFHQLKTYALSKRALLSFTLEFASRYPSLSVNLADPGVVASNMIDLGKWYDPLADAIFKPLCKKPEAGVAPALRALSSEESYRYFVGKGSRPIPERYNTPVLDREIWRATEEILSDWL